MNATDAAQRADIVATLRRTFGTYDDLTGLHSYGMKLQDPYAVDIRPVGAAVVLFRAARYLQAHRPHPEVTAAREAVTQMARNGEAPDVLTAPPEAFTARHHETVPKRSRKGRTTVEVKRYGVAPVSGALECTDVPTSDDAVTDEAVWARKMITAELRADHQMSKVGHTRYGARRVRLGSVSIDLTKMADRHYARFGLPALEGSDVRAYAQIIETPNGVDSHACRVAVSRSGITGAVSDSTVDEFVASSAVYRAHTRITEHNLPWDVRTELLIGQHRSLDARNSVVRSTRVRQTGNWPHATLRPLWTLHKLIAPASDLDHRWYGHALLVRPEPADTRTEADRTEAKARNDARTIGTVNAPTTRAAWFELLSALEVGERIIAESPSGKVTVTRGKTHFNARDKRTGREHVWQSRTVDSLAIRLA